MACRRKESAQGGLTVLCEGVDEAFDLRPAVGGQLQKGCDEALAEGIVRLGHEVVDHEGQLLVHGAGDEHLTDPVPEPGFGDVEHAADVRNCPIAGDFGAVADQRHKLLAQVQLLGKLGLCKPKVLHKESDALTYRIDVFHLLMRLG